MDNSDNVWVGTRNDGVCRYDGESWEQFTEADGVGKNYVKDIAIDSFGRIWCGTFEGGISVYDGDKWMTFTTFDGLPTNTILAVAIDSNDIVWAGTWAYGLCRFDVISWVTFTENDGLAQNYVGSIDFDKKGAVFFGTWSSGLSKYDPDATIVEGNHINNEILIFTNYPNPFNLTTRITFTLPSSGFTTLFIYSIIGQKVCELVSETMMPGTHSVIWDGKDTYGNPVSSGIYISKLTTKRNVTFNKMMLIE